MLTSHRLIRICRIALAAGLFIPAAGLLGAYSIPGVKLPLDSGMAHLGVFYGLTTLTFLAFPRNRRNDLCLVMVVFGIAIELGMQFSGRGLSLGRLAADLAGIYAVMVPGWIEEVRRAGRGKEWMSLSQAWQMNERRGGEPSLKASAPA